MLLREAARSINCSAVFISPFLIKYRYFVFKCFTASSGLYQEPLRLNSQLDFFRYSNRCSISYSALLSMAAENGAEQKISAISNRTFFMIKIRSHDRGDNQRSPAELWV